MDVLAKDLDLRKWIRVGDEISFPSVKIGSPGTSASQTNTAVCVVSEVYKKFAVVDHGKTKESVPFEEILTVNGRAFDWANSTRFLDISEI